MYMGYECFTRDFTLLNKIVLLKTKLKKLEENFDFEIKVFMRSGKSFCSKLINQ